jgi:protein-disulfide isomerase
VRLSPLLQRVLDQNPNTVKLVFLNFPLSSHKVAIKAAEAALAAHEQGKFWEFHEKLHESYRDLNEKKILIFAEEMKLDLDRFKKDVNSTSIRNLIKRDIQTGREIGIRGIPSIFVNGKAVKKRGPEGLQEMIDTELKKASR